MKQTWKTINNFIGKGQNIPWTIKLRMSVELFLQTYEDISNKFSDFVVNTWPKLASDIHNSGKTFTIILRM